MRILERQKAVAWRGGVARPVPIGLVALVLLLAAAAIGLEPTTARVCATMEDFPCGP